MDDLRLCDKKKQFNLYKTVKNSTVEKISLISLWIDFYSHKNVKYFYLNVEYELYDYYFILNVYYSQLKVL